MRPGPGVRHHTPRPPGSATRELGRLEFRLCSSSSAGGHVRRWPRGNMSSWAHARTAMSKHPSSSEQIQQSYVRNSGFPTARKLCAWAGLTPQVRNSDRTVRHGHITKQGSPGCAGSCKRPPRPPSATPCSPAPTASWLGAGGKNIATVAIARRLLARCFHILTQLEPTPEKASTGHARVFA
jgi:hypothetical protein